MPLPLSPLGRLDPRSVIMMVTFALTCVICIGFMFFGWFKYLLPQLRIKLGKVMNGYWCSHMKCQVKYGSVGVAT